MAPTSDRLPAPNCHDVSTYATVDATGCTTAFTITVQGTVDQDGVVSLQTACRRAHLSGAATVLVDLTACQALSPPALAALLGLARRVCRTISRELLLSPSPEVLDQLGQTQLTDYFAPGESRV
ncbi:MAG: hypothetical protein JWM31_339 [Solirubrobacterales bacterium]|nr:hypothetical protein [Solirubrobacterales bacterium]